MTATPLHLVIKVDADGDTLVAGPTSWHAAQDRWAELDAARRSGEAKLLTGTYYMVRALDDPAWAHLAPRLYPTVEHAARAIGRRLAGPGAKARYQRQALAELVNLPYAGWWALARAAERIGLIVVAQGGAAFLTPLVDQHAAARTATR